MSLNQDVEVLKKIPLFAKIEASKLKLLAFTSEHLRFYGDQVICKQGDVGDAAFIILEGDADIIVDTPDGPMTVASVGRNDIVGEIAILCDVPRTATVVARSDVATLRISKDSFFHLVTQFPQVGVEIMHELAARLHHTTQRLTVASTRLRDMDTPPDHA